MVLEYFDLKRFKKENTAKDPVLNDADEQFLHKITSQEEAPPFPEQPTVILDNGSKVRGKDAQTALMAGADQIPLPATPSAEDQAQQSSDEEDGKVSAEEQKRRNYWSYLPALPTMPSLPSRSGKGKEQAQTASDLQTAVDAVKAGEDPLADADADTDNKDENAELTGILDRLNLSAVNNRVFSFSKESEKLLNEFTQILKDLVNGVPTAYDDLEKLLTRSEGQLTKMYGNMPPFLKTLIMSLPAKMTGSLGPEFLAAVAEKPSLKTESVGAQSVGAQTAAAASASQDKKKQKRSGVPSLKSLVSQQGAVASMLRSILNFLKLRFPAFITGTNVLMSLSVFLLLFVFWYCHKRGRETRLTAEQIAAGETEDAEDSTVLEKPAPDTETTGEANEPPITINDDPGLEEKPSTTVEDMPSVLDLPEPKSVPLPKEKEAEAKEAPLEAK